MERTVCDHARIVHELQSTPPRTVTIVVHHVGPVGGMERQVTELVTGCLANGWHVTIIAWGCDIPAHPNLRFIRVRGCARPLALGLPWFWLASALLVPYHRCGLLHTNGAIYLGRSDVHTVHFLHHAFGALQDGHHGSRGGALYSINKMVVGRLSSLAERWCLRSKRVRAIVAISPGLSREISSHFPASAGRVEVIPYGLDHKRFAPQPVLRPQVRRDLTLRHEDLAVIFVGGEWQRKGLHHAIAAMVGAPRWQLLVVGEGDRVDAVKAAEALGVAPRVHLLGRIEDPERIYAAADAFVLPTTYETFSLVTHEAAAAGLPLLACRVSGIEDLIDPGRNGWFIERDGSDIASRLRALEDPALRKAFSAAAVRSAERYDWELAVAEHLQLYNRLDERRDLKSTRL